MVIFLVGFFIQPSRIQAVSLIDLAQGQVIYIAPTAGTYMCYSSYDANCDSLISGPKAEIYRLMATGVKDISSAYFVMLDNYCAWKSASCAHKVTTSSVTPISYGADWNFNGDTVGGYKNDLGGARLDRNILLPLDKFYSSLPSTIGGVAKAIAVPIKSFDITPVNAVAGTGTATYASCQTTTNNTAYGSIGATFNGTSCTMNSRVSLLSYDEWQGKSGSLPWAYGHWPASGAIGSAFCQARFGQDCTYGLFDKYTTLKAPYYPWTRTPHGGSASNVWYVWGVNATLSVYNGWASASNGVHPTLWLSSAICTKENSGLGTYNQPYFLEACPNVAPTTTLTSPGADTPWINTSTMTVVGNITDEDENAWTVYYGVNSGTTAPASWSILRDASANKSYSQSINHGQGASTTIKYVHVKVNDGAVDSPSVYRAFRVDTGKPSLTLNNYNASTYYNARRATVTTSDTVSGLSALRYVWSNSTSNPSNITASVCSGGSGITVTSGSTDSFTSTTANIAAPSYQGTNYLHVCSRDVAGNITKTYQTYLYDSVIPTISYTGTGVYYNSAQAKVTLTDVTSGLSAVRYAWNSNTNVNATTCTGGTGISGFTSGQTTAFTSTTLTAPPNQGANTLYVCSVDRAGNIRGSSATYYYDTIKPSTTQTPDTPPPSGGIYTQNPTITLSGNDTGGSGISNVRFQWDTSFASNAEATGSLAWQAAGSTTTIPENGTHTLYYQSRDNATNVSTVESVIYILDTDDPTTSLTFTNPGVAGENGWYTSAPTARVIGHPATESVSVVGLTIDAQAGTYNSSYTPTTYYDLSTHPSDQKYVDNLTPKEGISTLYYFSTSQSSRSSSVSYTTLKLDSNPPTCTGWAPSGANWSSDQEVIFTLTNCFDLPPESSPEALVSGLSSGNIYTCTTPPVNEATCDITIYDKAGNAQTYTSPPNHIDTLPPIPTQTSDPSVPESGAYEETPIITISATDDTSGIAGVRFSWVLFEAEAPAVGDLIWLPITPLPPTTTIPSRGNHTLYYQAIDVAGNLSEVLSTDYLLNTTPTLSLDNPTESYYLDIGDAITLSGTYTDPDPSQTLFLSLSIYETADTLYQSPLHTFPISLPTSTTPFTDESWSTTIAYSDLINYGESFAFVLNLTDGISPSVAESTRIITLSSLLQLTDALSKALEVRFAGQVYFPQSVLTTMASASATTYEGYSYLSTLDYDHQIWAKDLLLHPTIATFSASPTTSYPFLVKGMPDQEKLGEIDLVKRD